MTEEKFEQWVLLELMGRQRIAGLCTEQTIAGHGYLRIDVPETKGNPAFTRLISPNSVYAINPITEEVARAYAENLKVKPIDAWDIQSFMMKVEEQRLLMAARESEQEQEEQEREDDEPFN